MERMFAVLGALSAGLAVVAGAFAAHDLRARLAPELLAAFETGARYQMYHALGLLAVAWALGRWRASGARIDSFGLWRTPGCRRRSRPSWQHGSTDCPPRTSGCSSPRR